MSRQLLNISKDGDSTTSLDNLCLVLSYPDSENVFPDAYEEPHVFQFVLIDSGPVTGHH